MFSFVVVVVCCSCLIIISPAIDCAWRAWQFLSTKQKKNSNTREMPLKRNLKREGPGANRKKEDVRVKSADEFLEELTEERGWRRSIVNGKYKVALEGNGERTPEKGMACELKYSIGLPLGPWKLKKPVNLPLTKLDRLFDLWTEILTNVSAGSRVLIYVPTATFYETYPENSRLVPPKPWLADQVTEISMTQVLSFDIQLKSCEFLRFDLMRSESRTIVLSCLVLILAIGVAYFVYVNSFAQRMPKSEEQMSKDVLNQLKRKQRNVSSKKND